MRARAAPAALLDLLVVWISSAPGWAPLLRGKMVGSQDGYFHLFRLLELDRAARAGDLYPRWAPDFALGYGYPVFNYYAPLALYLALPWRLIGAGLTAWESLIGSASFPPRGAPARP